MKIFKCIYIYVHVYIYMNNIIKRLKITFIRHGTTEYNIQDRVQGNIDIPLSIKGLDDINNVELLHTNYDAYYHSPLSRAKDTLLGVLLNYDLLLDDTKIYENKYITERGYGIFEGLTKKDIEEKHPELYNEWMTNENVQHETIESVEGVIERIKIFISKIISYPHENILVVTHSGFLYALYKFITDQSLDLKPQEMDVSFPNCCLVELAVNVLHSHIEFILKIQNKEFCKNISH